MDTTVDALKGMYVALGGSADDVVNITLIPDMIIALTPLVASAMELPKVSSSNNGQVLTVVSGKWAKADIPSQLPAVSASNNGQVLTVDEGAWKAKDLPS